jgi:aspartyl protease family protein|tara:strand:- start:636 stop:1289 length:654 start_codon:yes stop_codon:yes gene_type:complete
MPTKKAVNLTTLSLLMVAAQACGEPTSVVVEALMGKAAVLMIDGQRKMLGVGESFAGVTLVATEATAATVEVDGRTETVGLSQHVATTYQKLEERVVTIARDSKLQYQTNAIINGRSALVLVDTGANVVAISSFQAKAMGVNYTEDGTPSQVETASGVIDAHSVTLQSVSVGGLQVDNVPATVIEGAYPATILLGMSYLRHVKIQEHDGMLSLSKSQ